jgi:hypothetical protein
LNLIGVDILLKQNERIMLLNAIPGGNFDYVVFFVLIFKFAVSLIDFNAITKCQT